MSTRFAIIPNDVHYLIFSEFAESKGDLFRSLLISKSIFPVVERLLYRHILIRRACDYVNVLNLLRRDAKTDCARRIRLINTIEFIDPDTKLGYWGYMEHAMWDNPRTRSAYLLGSITLLVGTWNRSHAAAFPIHEETTADNAESHFESVMASPVMAAPASSAPLHVSYRTSRHGSDVTHALAHVMSSFRTADDRGSVGRLTLFTIIACNSWWMQPVGVRNSHQQRIAEAKRARPWGVGPEQDAHMALIAELKERAGKQQREDEDTMADELDHAFRPGKKLVIKVSVVGIV